MSKRQTSAGLAWAATGARMSDEIENRALGPSWEHRYQRPLNAPLTDRARLTRLTPTRHRVQHSPETGDNMTELLKIIHFLSFSVAIGAGLANIMAGYRLMSLPAEAMPKVAAFRLRLGMFTTVGLGLLWLTGLWLAALVGASLLSNGLFLLKLVAVIALTGISVMANLTIIRARKAGTPPDAARMKQLGHAGPALAVLALILAVLAFT